jgi:glycosyltransferase involved in cell wall biosynthesis
MEVSVIIPCFKMGRFIGEALASVGTQTHGNWEVIAVDDCGPEDGTRQAVADFARQFPDHRVEYICHAANRGVSAARNTAALAAKGKFLAFLDPDDLWLPEKLQKQLQVFEADKSAVMVYSQARILRSGAGVHYAAGTEITGNPPGKEMTDDVLAVASGKVMFAFSSLVLKKEIFAAVGGFQENLPFQNEDRLLIGSSAFFGRMTWVAEPLCVYRMHDGSATTSVIQKDIVHLVEFDLVARIALWLRQQPRGRSIGSQIVNGVLRGRLVQTLATPSWLRSHDEVVDLCAQLALAYPRAGAFFLRQLLRQSRALAFGRRVARHLICRGTGPQKPEGPVKKSPAI